MAMHRAASLTRQPKAVCLRDSIAIGDAGAGSDLLSGELLRKNAIRGKTRAPNSNGRYFDPLPQVREGLCPLEPRQEAYRISGRAPDLSIH